MFQVANRVTVQSRGYSFILDAKKDLGMISPIWCDDPVPAEREGWTGMYLDFGDKEPSPYSVIEAQLEEIRDYVPLFLRKLSIVKINVNGSHFSVERVEDKDNSRVTLITTRTTDTCSSSKHYMVSKKTIPMEPDHRREGRDETEIVLAFPLGGDGHPDLSTQPNVHAFLPLRPVGFKVCLPVLFCSFITSNLIMGRFSSSYRPTF